MGAILRLLILLVLAIRADATIAYVASVATGLGANGGTSASVNTSGANFLVGMITSFAGAAAPTYSDGTTGCANPCNTWTALTTYTGNSRQQIQIFYSQNPTVGSGHTCKASAVTNSFSTCFLMAFSGMLTSGVFQAGTDSGAHNAGLTSTIAPGSITPGSSPALVVSGYEGDQSFNLTSVGSSFIIPTSGTVNFLASNWFGGSMAYLIQSTAAAVNPTWQDGGNDNLIANIAAFQGSSGVVSTLHMLTTLGVGQ